MISFPNIKINLGLHIVNKRDDGFHNIESVFYPVPFCDTLEVIENKQPAAEKVVMQMEGLSIAGTSADNLVIKAYELLDQSFKLPPVKVCLLKNIPMGAGLGGGSSDAAFMLKLLNEKFALHQTTEQLKDYAAQLGSDCAFFIHNKPAYLFGKGHELEPFDINLKGYHLVLIAPPVHSSTALAYRGAKIRGQIGQSLKELLHQPIYTWRNAIQNDFEQNVFTAYPILAQFKQSLYDSGAEYAAMSGSGSALFGLYTETPVLPDELASYQIFSGML